MSTLHDVRRWHESLPQRMRSYLNARGIPTPVIDLHLLGWNGRRITIPIFDREGSLAFVKLAKDPADHGSWPKMLCPAGGHSELYGWERLRTKPPRIVICEGEFDRLVLEGHGIAAVTSTGGARVFRPEWAEAFAPIDEVYVCYDRDEAGRLGAERVATLIPKARIVTLPPDVGDGGDVTDYFVRFGKTKIEFLTLLRSAAPLPPEATSEVPVQKYREPQRTHPWSTRIERVKAQTSIAQVIGEYVTLRPLGNRLTGRCPFHEDRHPSFVVYPPTRSFYCFGCGKHGDVVNFVMSIEDITLREALSRLEDGTLHYEGDAASA